MNTWPTPVERNLRQVEQRWKWFRFVEYSATVAAIVMLAILLLGGMKTLGWFSSATALAIFIAMIVVAGCFAWFIGGIVVAVSEKERRWLAAAIEQSHAPLQDRLNTLVHLEQGEHPQETKSYATHIERQAQVVLAKQDVPPPLSPNRPLGRLLVSVMLLLVTIWFYNRFHPLRAVAAELPMSVAAAEPEAEIEAEIDIPPPETEIFEQPSTWGEVRITDPARDVVVTRVETIPLQIEAATSDALSSVEWITAVNGADEQPHVLPAPAEPRYAAYAPEISVEEFPLSDWDVLTYYAKATTEKGQSYRSEIYFVEVQPFREELEKMASGQSGQCSNLLNELTGMIERQQELIRQTYRSQATADNDGESGQTRDQIAKAEAELAQATNHLSARMAAEFDEAAIAEPLSRLEQAESNMRDATGSLRDNAVDQSIRQERSALSELSSARKQFQKCIASNPDEFGPKPNDLAQLPDLAEALKRIAEFRDEEKAAQDFMNKTITQQRNIARQASAGQPQPKPPLAEQELGLQKSLEEFQQQHPQMFRGTEKECTGAQESLRQSAEAMRQGHPTMQTLPGEATKQLEALQQAMQQQTQEQQLGDAYRLKSVLDKLIDQFAQLERDPDSMTQEQTEQAASQAQEVAKQLQKLAENQPTSEQFEQELRDAVNEERQQQLQSQCNSLCQSQNAGEKSGNAAGVKGQLQQMAGAFEQSAPQSLAKSKQQSQSGDSSQTAAQESLERGLRQLEGLAKNAQQGRSLSPADEAKQRSEALQNVQNGVRGLYGDNERSQAMLSELEQDLEDSDVPVDVAVIDRLVRQLEKRQIEAAAAGTKNPAEQPATLIDPARLPPAYRRQIEKYFEKLSEQQ